MDKITYTIKDVNNQVVVTIGTLSGVISKDKFSGDLQDFTDKCDSLARCLVTESEAKTQTFDKTITDVIKKTRTIDEFEAEVPIEITPIDITPEAPVEEQEVVNA